MVEDPESSTEDNGTPPPDDHFPETFPDFDSAKIASARQKLEGRPKNRDAPTSDYQPPTEEQIQAAIQRANLAFSNPLTNVPRRGPAGAGRARNRSAEVSFNLPSTHRNLPPQPVLLPQASTTGPLPTVASGSGRGRGIPVPGRAAYIPTLPAANRTAQLIRPRAPNSSRPVVVGGYDNPFHEHLQRVAQREADDRRAFELYLNNPPRRLDQQPHGFRPLPELPPASTIQPTVVAPARAFEAPLPAQNTAPPHPLRSNPVASNQQEPFPVPSRRRQRSASVSIPSNAPPFVFPGTSGNRPPPEPVNEEASTEHEEFEYSEDPEVHTARVGRVVRRADDPAKDSSDVSLRGGSLDIDDFLDGFDPDYYESDALEDDLTELDDEFNPNISEDFDPYQVEANSRIYAQVLHKMASHIPRPGPANLSPNAGLDEWLEEAKQCHYLPERAMKELCELVKEVLMEGKERKILTDLQFR